MRRSLVQAVVPWEDVLLEARSTTLGPNPVALRLVDLPLIRAVQKLEAPVSADGRLPLHAYTASLRGRRPDGSSYDVVVKGDDKHGLPYGSDGDILFALFKIADEIGEPARTQLITTGKFRDPTVGMIARAMGRPMNGETSRRIREALHRLSHLRIEMHVTQAAQELATLLLAQSTAVEADTSAMLRPVEPDGGPVPKLRKGVDTVGVLHVLEYAVSRAYDRRSEGEDWISHLQINPLWLRELAAGWAAWINVERYVALRSPIAKRLYQLFAGEAARGVATPWSYGLADLQEQCGMVGIARRPAAVRDSVHEAAAELIEWEILGAVDYAKIAHGRYAFSFEPGPQLRMAALLRGVGALDARELRVQRMLLRYFGVTRDHADRMLAERPSRVHDALQYLLYVRDTDHTRVKRSWAAYLLKLVDGETNLAGDVRYQAWLQRQRQQRASSDPIALARSSMEAGAGVAHATGDGQQNRSLPITRLERADWLPEVERVPAINAARTVPVSKDAVALWSRARDRAVARYPQTHRAYVEDLAAYDLVGDTLTCITASEFTLRKVESVGLEAIQDELSAASDGQVTVLHLEVFQRERHEGQRLRD